jgi:hypothetical protein
MARRAISAAILVAMGLVPSACDAIIGLSAPSVAGAGDGGRDARLDALTVDDVASEGAPEESGADACMEGACAPAVLVADAGDVAGIAVAGGNLYWIDSQTGRVLWCSTSGCASPRVLFTPKVFTPGSSTVSGISVQGSSVVFGEGTPSDLPEIYACGLTGCSSPSTISSMFAIGAVATDSVNVYWTGGGDVYACGAPSVCSAGGALGAGGWVSSDLGGLAVTGDHVYFAAAPPQGSTADVSVGWCMPSACEGGPQFLESVGELTTAVGANASGVFWATASKVYASTPPMPSVSPPPAKLVASTLSGATTFAADDLAVFFASAQTGGGTIYACASPSCAHPTTVATNVGNISAIAVDAGRVYAAVTGSVTQIVWLPR